jgi:hypothetical protein
MKKPIAHLDFRGLRVNTWLATLAARTIPPGYTLYSMHANIFNTFKYRGTDQAVGMYGADSPR